MIKTETKQLFIFVVNEEKKEFSRYKLFNLTGTAPDLNFKYYQEEKYTVAVVRNDDIKKEIEQLLNQCREYIINGPNVDKLTDAMSKDDEQKDETDKILCNLVDKFSTFKKFITIDFSSFNEVTFFVHWGGGDIVSIRNNEILFNNFLKSALYDNFSAFSLSSLRKQIFDVTAREILVPDFDGLIELKNRLSVLSQLDERLLKFQLICDILSSKEMNLDSELTEDKLKDFKDYIEYIITNCNFDWLKDKKKTGFINELNDFPFLCDEEEMKKRRLENFALILSRIDKEFY